MYAIAYRKRPNGQACFIANVKRRGRTYLRRFAVEKYGGSEAALTAAIQWRDKCLAEKRVCTLLEFHSTLRSNNTSGVAGVTYLKSEKQPLGIWQAKISLRDGRRLCRQFSVRKFGYEEAFARAVAARSEFLKLVADQPYVLDPTAERVARQLMATAPVRS
jgi:hypothetical protein